MNKIKILAASILFVFAVASVNMVAADKATTKSANTQKSSCCETATKDAKDASSSKCCGTKTASVKNAKSSCCSSAKETKLEATKASSEVKTVVKTPSK